MKKLKKKDFGGNIDWNVVLGSNITTGLAQGLVNNGANSFQNAILRWNQQQANPLNQLPQNPNTSLQALYGMNYSAQGGNLFANDPDASFLFEEEEPNIVQAAKQATSTLQAISPKQGEPEMDEAMMLALSNVQNNNENLDEINTRQAVTPVTFRTKKGADVSNLNPSITNAYNALSQMFPGVAISSGRDGKHMTGSRHYSGRAIDIGANSSNKDAYASMLKYLKANPDFKKQYGLEDIIDEGDHTHIELPDHKSGGWIKKASDSIKKRGTEGKCTPITKSTCTGRAKALAKTFKKIAKNRKKHEEGGIVDLSEGITYDLSDAQIQELISQGYQLEF